MTPYALLLIKPMSVGRGDAPNILDDILTDCPVVLSRFRVWGLCDTTLTALTRPDASYPSSLQHDDEYVHVNQLKPWWICVFTHKDRESDPITVLEDYCGPLSSDQRLHTHLRFRYSQHKGALHPSDTVVHIATPDRVACETNMLFKTFDPALI